MTLRLNVIGLRLADSARVSRMIQRAVVALGVIFDRHFPVADFRYLDPRQRVQLLYVRNIFADFSFDTGIPLTHRPGVLIEIDKNETAKYFSANFAAMVVTGIEKSPRLTILIANAMQIMSGN